MLGTDGALQRKIVETAGDIEGAEIVYETARQTELAIMPHYSGSCSELARIAKAR